MQPLGLREPNQYGKRVIRFKKNKVVRFLLNHGGYDLNKIWGMDFPIEDMVQFYQLIGYSAGGFGEIFYEEAPEVVEEIDEIWESMTEERKIEKGSE